ncbi:Transcription factor bye1 [Chytriomyces hyalinus]|nr:Transcription factor bye1 [Chytriomyces hyalinus]
MPLNAREIQFGADDIENEHEVEKHRVAEISPPSNIEFSPRGEAAHIQITSCKDAVEREEIREGGSIGSTLCLDSKTSKANAKRLVREVKQPYNEKGERVYCICRAVDDGNFMIQCDHCKDWYHGACVDITERQGRAITRYDCLQCVQSKNDLMWGDVTIEGFTPEQAHAGEKSVEGIDLTKWLDVTELAGTMEDALFELTADGVKGLHRTCGDKYKAKFRSLQFNLKDKKNSTLRTRLLSGNLPASSPVKLEHRDLVNNKLRARAEAIHLQSIHDAIKPKIEDAMYKKTHKGDEVVVGDVSSMPGIGAASSSASAIPAFGSFGADNLKDDDDTVMSPVAAVKQSGIAGIMAAVEAAKLAARVSGGPAKRGSAEVYNEETAKKSRIDQEALNVNTSGIGNGGSSSWDHLAASDKWTHVDDADGRIRSPGDDLADFKPFASASNTPSGSPRESAEPVENDGVVIWNGLVRMPQVGKFTGRWMQIAGKPLGSSKALWESILPPTVFIEGRIDVSRTQSYISQQHSSLSKEVIALEFFC